MVPGLGTTRVRQRRHGAEARLRKRLWRAHPHQCAARGRQGDCHLLRPLHWRRSSAASGLCAAQHHRWVRQWAGAAVAGSRRTRQPARRRPTPADPESMTTHELKVFLLVSGKSRPKGAELCTAVARAARRKTLSVACFAGARRGHHRRHRAHRPAGDCQEHAGQWRHWRGVWRCQWRCQWWCQRGWRRAGGGRCPLRAEAGVSSVTSGAM